MPLGPALSGFMHPHPAGWPRSGVDEHRPGLAIVRLQRSCTARDRKECDVGYAMTCGEVCNEQGHEGNEREHPHVSDKKLTEVNRVDK